MRDTSRVIVALDVESASKAQEVLAHLGERSRFYKVGLQLFIKAGPQFVRDLIAADKSVFLDLKLHEIPNSITGAVRAAGELGVAMLTVHASSGSAGLRAAVAAAKPFPELKIVAVTVVTSMEDAALADIGVRDEVSAQVLRLASLAHQAGCHGVVASAQEAAALRSHFGNDFVIVTPGIQLSELDNDQSRTESPAQAWRAGADYLVVGRAILDAPDSVAARDACLNC